MKKSRNTFRMQNWKDLLGGSKGGKQLNDDPHVSDLETADGNRESQRRSKTSEVWEGRGGEGFTSEKLSLRWLWMVLWTRNVQEKEEHVVLKVRRVEVADKKWESTHIGVTWNHGNKQDGPTKVYKVRRVGMKKGTKQTLLTTVGKIKGNSIGNRTGIKLEREQDSILSLKLNNKSNHSFSNQGPLEFLTWR